MKIKNRILVILIIVLFPFSMLISSNDEKEKRNDKTELFERQKKINDLLKKYNDRQLLSLEDRFKDRKKLTPEKKAEMRMELHNIKDSFSNNMNSLAAKKNLNITINKDKDGKVIGFNFGPNVSEKVKKYFKKNKNRFSKFFWQDKAGIQAP